MSTDFCVSSGLFVHTCPRTSAKNDPEDGFINFSTKMLLTGFSLTGEDNNIHRDLFNKHLEKG